MPVYPTAGANVGRLDLEVFPGFPMEYLIEFNPDLTPGAVNARIGDQTISATLDGDVVTVSIDDVDEGLVGQAWVLFDGAGGEPVLAGEVRRWSGAGAVSGAVEVLPSTGSTVLVRSVRGDPGPIGPASADAGLLAERPAADEVSDGWLYAATDDNGGQAAVSKDDAWVSIGPARGEIGGYVLASCWPTAVAALAHPGAPTNILAFPELTTATFTWPDRPVRIRSNRAVVTVTGGTTASGVNWAYQYKIGAGAWTMAAYSPANELSGASSLNFPADLVRIPFPHGLAPTPAPGDSVQVRATLHYAGTGRTFEPFVNVVVTRAVGFDVIAG